ncbi:SAVED domain-containing protein [Gymnodinialimonas ulvae]|uniref:SAVED domain-containing protein n=1 Tax=Gymnodinialimonas ulvae TaxID=3126504 RepID=UPI0030EC6476
MSNRGKQPREVTKLLVWGRAAGRCQFRNCRKALDHDLIAGKAEINAAYLAHIIASSPNGKRGHPTRSHELSDDAANIMLMCDVHHRAIDGEDTWQDYPEDLLLKWKKDHEDWVDLVLSSGPESRSHILQFSAPVGPNETAVAFDDCVDAILPERTPAERRPTEIKVRGMHFQDTDDTYWSVQPETLRAGIERSVRGRFENGDIRHLSVFGLAPIPLLMELGRLVSDISDADVYERHREPVQWKWPEDGPEVDFNRTKGRPEPKHVALKLSVTSHIADHRITEVIGEDVSIWDISSDPQTQGVIRHKSDLSRYRSIVRTTLDEIKNVHGMDVSLSVFPAIPVSCAIEFGRVWQPKAHPSVDIFDQVRGRGFVRRLSFDASAED